MNLFKSSKVNLHPVEKVILLCNCTLVSLFLFFGIGNYLITEFHDIRALFGYLLIVFSVVYVVEAYRILHGKGLNRKW